MNKNRESYNKICDSWSEYRGKSRINTCIVEFAKNLEPGAKVLDVGCGSGYPIAAYLSEQGFFVTGIDISEKMIEKAQSLKVKNAEFLLEDVLTFRAAEKYDGVIAFDAIWHIPQEQQRDIYVVVADLLNDGGYFLFTHGKTEGSVSGKMFGEEFYYSALDVEEVHRLLGEHGFEIQSSMEDYKEETTGSRDLLIVARKKMKS